MNNDITFLRLLAWAMFGIALTAGIWIWIYVAALYAAGKLL